jgi:hypothetical protein
MLDLHEGILELFADAQRAGVRRAWRRRRDEGLEIDGHCARLLEKYERARRIDSDLRAIRAARGPYVIATLPVERAVCSGCGGVLERRAGLSYWQHMGAPRTRTCAPVRRSA